MKVSTGKLVASGSNLGYVLFQILQYHSLDLESVRESEWCNKQRQNKDVIPTQCHNMKILSKSTP